MKNFKITAKKDAQEFSYLMPSDDKPNAQQAFDYLVMHHPSKLTTPPVHEPLSMSHFTMLNAESA
jgi:hypothetical protein